jgi:hypothetical protein
MDIAELDRKFDLTSVQRSRTVSTLVNGLGVAVGALALDRLVRIGRISGTLRSFALGGCIGGPIAIIGTELAIHHRVKSEGQRLLWITSLICASVAGSHFGTSGATVAGLGAALATWRRHSPLSCREIAAALERGDDTTLRRWKRTEPLLGGMSLFPLKRMGVGFGLAKSEPTGCVIYNIGEAARFVAALHRAPGHNDLPVNLRSGVNKWGPTILDGRAADAFLWLAGHEGDIIPLQSMGQTEKWICRHQLQDALHPFDRSYIDIALARPPSPSEVAWGERTGGSWYRWATMAMSCLYQRKPTDTDWARIGAIFRQAPDPALLFRGNPRDFVPRRAIRDNIDHLRTLPTSRLIRLLAVFWDLKTPAGEFINYDPMVVAQLLPELKERLTLAQPTTDGFDIDAVARFFYHNDPGELGGIALAGTTGRDAVRPYQALHFVEERTDDRDKDIVREIFSLAAPAELLKAAKDEQLSTLGKVLAGEPVEEIPLEGPALLRLVTDHPDILFREAILQPGTVQWGQLSSQDNVEIEMPINLDADQKRTLALDIFGAFLARDPLGTVRITRMPRSLCRFATALAEQVLQDTHTEPKLAKRILRLVKYYSTDEEEIAQLRERWTPQLPPSD